MLVYRVIVLQVPYNYKQENIKEYFYGCFKNYEDAKKEYENAVAHFKDDDNYFYKGHIQTIQVKD
jgi:hypothetical protein